MRAALYALAIPLALCACESRVGKAEREYRMAKSAGAHAAEICARADAVTEAYLQAGDEESYRVQKGRSETECYLARSDETAGIVRGPDGNVIQAENLDAVMDNAAAFVAAHEPHKVKPAPEPTYDNPDDPPDGAPYDNSVQ